MTDYVLDGRYALIERIATGGMGEVWRGTDQILGRPVAIKMLAAMHADDEQFRARFRAEARYASSLSHPGITRVFDYGESSPLGGPYLIMELVDGQPLSEILERYGTLDPYVVLDIVAQAARALDAAHQADIVHRDIKPGNLLIMADGTTKITDFGIAKANSLQALNLTATGIVMGTALYVSPEQATGSPLTGSSDIYSLGVVAYECLAGEPPFVADQPLAIAIMHKHEPVPPLPPEVPAQVAELVYAMLAKTPEGRPESARHVADRAEVIREARQRSGYTGPLTSSLPVVPNFPSGPHEFYQNDAERARGSRRPGPRSILLAAIGVAACSVLAIVAIVLSSSDAPAQLKGTGSTPSQPGGSFATVSGTGTATSGGDPGTNLGTESGTATSSSSKSPTAKRTGKGKSTPVPTQSTPTTTVSPIVSTTITSIPVTSSSSPPVVVITSPAATTPVATTSSPDPTTSSPDPTTSSPTANDQSPTASPTDSTGT